MMCRLLILLGIAALFQDVNSFSSSKLSVRSAPLIGVKHRPVNINSSIILQSEPNGDNDGMSVASSDQLVLGIAGTFASLVTFYSEYTLGTTGCGLPAGPFGIVGLVEGLSYLGVTGLAAYSVVTKKRTGSGLPAGPFGLVGAAEGLSFLAILAGLVVLALQVTNYGYIPNAVPMEGAMCS